MPVWFWGIDRGTWRRLFIQRYPAQHPRGWYMCVIDNAEKNSIAQHRINIAYFSRLNGPTVKSIIFMNAACFPEFWFFFR